MLKDFYFDEPPVRRIAISVPSKTGKTTDLLHLVTRSYT
jgi:hypothetical protein